MHRRLWIVMLGLIVWALLMGGRFAGAASVRLVSVVPYGDAVPSRSFDISWVDPTTQLLYFTDRGTPNGGNGSIDIIDSFSTTFVGRIPGFVGSRPNNAQGSTSGPNGVLVVQPDNQLWAGDGDSTVKVVDLTKGTIIATISTGGTNRADELAYDAKDRLIVVANDADVTPFFTFISTINRSIVSQLLYPNAAGNGIEQPVWSPNTGHFYVAIPKTPANPDGEILELNPTTSPPSIVRAIPTPGCAPHGLTLGPFPNALVGCSGSGLAVGSPHQTHIINIQTGDIVKTITKVGGSDEVWYNPGDNRYYLGASSWTTTGKVGGALLPVLGIIDAGSNTFLANVETSVGAHSVAVNPITNAVFMPFRAGAVAVFEMLEFVSPVPPSPGHRRPF